MSRNWRDSDYRRNSDEYGEFHRIPIACRWQTVKAVYVNGVPLYQHEFESLQYAACAAGKSVDEVVSAFQKLGEMMSERNPSDVGQGVLRGVLRDAVQSANYHTAQGVEFASFVESALDKADAVAQDLVKLDPQKYAELPQRLATLRSIMMTSKLLRTQLEELNKQAGAVVKLL